MFDKIANSDINVSKQNNLYSDTGWWTLFEWNNIPRLQGSPSINICINRDDIFYKTDCHSLPQLDGPPLILVWGSYDFEYNSTVNNFRIYTDKNGRELLRENVTNKLSKQYEYLSRIFPAKDIPKGTINIVWVGIDKKWSEFGGAAGKSAYISNYVIDNNVVDKLSQERLLWVCGHETFHMIAPYSYPLWISESLAQYYGYKSLSQFSSTLSTPIQDWESKKHLIPNGSTGLNEAHRKV